MEYEVVIRGDNTEEQVTVETHRRHTERAALAAGLKQARKKWPRAKSYEAKFPSHATLTLVADRYGEDYIGVYPRNP